MARRINQMLTIIMASCVGVFIGHGLYVCWDYRARPDLYAMQSAPWYVSIWLYGAVTLVVLAVGLVGKIILRRWQKRGSS